MKIEDLKTGIGSFLKWAVIPVNYVSIFSVFARTRAGETRWNVKAGELLITNSRIILFYDPKPSSSANIDKAVSWPLNTLEQIWYEGPGTQLTFLRFTDEAHELDLGFHMNFPSGSLGQLAVEDRLGVESLKHKAVGARTVMHQFLLAVIHQNQVRLATEVSPQESPEVLELFKKLGELKNAGLISEDEFDQKKRELLSRL
ncbi:MAG TPA: SHOCT domain-containing protein [Ardenticatenaceae bacterium]|jgi:hypothetical protein